MERGSRTMTVESRLMTTVELEAIPDDGKERWLIDGQLRVAGEEDGEVTRRNRGHSRIEATIAAKLQQWSSNQPEPRGEVLVGEAGFRLAKDPDTTAGVDVAYISAETAAANPNEDEMVDGAPVLAVEILSPYDKHEEVVEKVATYLK